MFKLFSNFIDSFKTTNVALIGRLAKLERHVGDLETDVFALRKQVHYWQKGHEQLKAELDRKVSYDAFENFENHMAHLESIFA